MGLIQIPTNGLPPNAPAGTPERTARLNSEGTILPGIEYVMYVLQQIYPRRVFPSGNTSGTDSDRREQYCTTGWVRGGTSPSGASLGGPSGGNYFVGNPEKYIENSTPQRIVWEPIGAEWGDRQITGYQVDEPTELLPQLHVPYSTGTEGTYRIMGAYAGASFATRIISCDVHLWGNDYNDEEALLHWLGSAFQTCFNGNINGQPLIGPERWIPDEKSTRGQHAILTVRFAAPVYFPLVLEIPARSASMTPELVVPPETL